MAYQNYYGGYGAGYVYPSYTGYAPAYGAAPGAVPPAQPQAGMPAQAVAQTPQNAPQNNFHYVNGIEGAKAFMMPANTTYFLMDNDNPCFYIKSSDFSGRSTMKIFDFRERTENPLPEATGAETAFDPSNLASKEDVKILNEKLEELKSFFAASEPKRPAPKTAQKAGEQA